MMEERFTVRSSCAPSKPSANSRTMGYRSAKNTAIKPTESKNDMVITWSWNGFSSPGRFCCRSV